MRTPIRFRAETKYQESAEKKANTNLPAMATVGDHLTGAAAVAGRPGWYHIRLGGETVANPNPTVASRLTQCKAEGVGLVLNDLIFVIKAKDRNLTYYKFHSFIQNTAGTSPYPTGIVIADNVAQAYSIVDDDSVGLGSPEYLRIDTRDGVQVVTWNFGGADVDFVVEASVADAFVIRGSDSQITLGILGAGLLESNAGGVIASDYTINLTVTMASGQDIDPTDASGQDLGNAGALWDLYTQNVIFGGATGANVITVPDNVADALHVVDAGDAVNELLTFVTTNTLREVVVNEQGHANTDFRVEGVGAAHALFVEGATADVSMGLGVPLAQLHVDQYSATGNQPTLFLDQGDVSEQCIQFSSDAVDRDINLYTVNVTGAPRLMWDETNDIFLWSTHLGIDGSPPHYIYMEDTGGVLRTVFTVETFGVVNDRARVGGGAFEEIALENSVGYVYWDASRHLYATSAGHTEVQVVTTGLAHNIAFRLINSQGHATEQQWNIFCDGLGGTDDLVFRDATGGVSPMTIEQTAPTNTLYLDSTGGVGFGTGAPGSLTEWNFADEDLEFVDAHVATGIGSVEAVVEVITPTGGTGYIAIFDSYVAP